MGAPPASPPTKSACPAPVTPADSDQTPVPCCCVVADSDSGGALLRPAWRCCDTTHAEPCEWCASVTCLLPAKEQIADLTREQVLARPTAGRRARVRAGWRPREGAVGTRALARVLERAGLGSRYTADPRTPFACHALCARHYCATDCRARDEPRRIASKGALPHSPRLCRRTARSGFAAR